jgi:hypothetical protein
MNGDGLNTTLFVASEFQAKIRPDQLGGVGNSSKGFSVQEKELGGKQQK